MSPPLQQLALRHPDLADGAGIHALAAQCPPLESNSCYSYVLIASHFRDTSAVAEDGEGLLGFVAAYRRPDAPGVLFVWQVGVSARARGAGVARRLLSHLIRHPAPVPVRYLEATVAPSNTASQRLFRALAAEHGVICEETPYLEPGHFGGGNHEAEALFRLGPFR